MNDITHHEMTQPFETLSRLRGTKVTVINKDEQEIEGTLVAFDLNMNVTLETNKGLQFLSGSTVVRIYASTVPPRGPSALRDTDEIAEMELKQETDSPDEEEG